MNYTLLEKALDLNNNGKISKNDFMLLLEKAAVSSADTSKYHKTVQ